MLYSHKLLAGTLSLVLIAGFASPAFAGVGGFSGEFDPSNWTEFTEGNGFVDSMGAPASITVVGSDESIGCGGIIPFESNNLLAPRGHTSNNCVTDFTITMPCTGTVSFDWSNENSIEGSFNDPPGYLVNGAFTVLIHDSVDSDSQNVAVQQGDIFGFRVDATDDVAGFGVFDISNFFGPSCVVGGEFLPIDSTALILAGAQTNSVWIMSALAVIGSVAFGALYITTKKN